MHTYIPFFVVATCFATPLLADTLEVGAGKPYSTIQAAVDDAVDGDQVLVYPGTYSSTANNVVVVNDKSISIKSTGGSAQTFIDGEGVRRCVRHKATGTGSLLEGFTLRNGWKDSSATYGGSGLFLFMGELHIKSCDFVDNYAMNGGGAMVQESTAVFSNCTFKSNLATSYGGGIYATASDLTLEAGTTISDNSATDGGGLALVSLSSQAMFFSTTICGNNPGGNVYLSSSSYQADPLTEIKDDCDNPILALVDTELGTYITFHPIPPYPYQWELAEVVSLDWAIDLADVEFDPSGELIVSDPGLGMISRVDEASGEFLGDAFPHGELILPVDVQFSGETAIVSDIEMGLFAFDRVSGEELAHLSLFPNAMADAGDGRVFLSGSIGPMGYVKMWNPRTAELGSDWRHPAFQVGGKMAVRRDGSLLVVDPAAAKIHIFDTDGTHKGYFGSADDSVLINPADIKASSNGSIYILDGTGGLHAYSQGGAYQGVIVAGDPTGAWTPSLIVVAEPDPVPWTPGDIDGDNRVGGADLGLMLANWGSPSNPRADLNGDGAVSGADLGLLLSRWTN